MKDGARDSGAQAGRTAAGLSVSGGLLTGAGALVTALAAVLSGDFVGCGVCLVAAALAFGLLANAVYRQ